MTSTPTSSKVRRTRSLRAARIIAVSVFLAGAIFALTGTRGSDPARAQGASSNILVVMTDDQTVADLAVMQQTNRLIGAAGASFSNSFVNFPLCCPSRATLLTGQYAQNHKIRNGYGFKDLDHSNTVPVWLDQAGYRTGHVGKYMNGYGDPDRNLVPPGWDEWYGALPDDQLVYDYDLNENGTQVHYGSTAADFKGDVITAKALDFLNRNAAGPDPFFLSVGYTAPHRSESNPPCPDSAEPAPRHLGTLSDMHLPGTGSFNEADVSDKHAQVRGFNLLGPAAIAKLDDRYRCRLESLLHVDEGVASMVDALGAAGALDNTLIVFTSDNGFFIGEHRIPGGKLRAYDEALRVPLMMRGPGVQAGSVINDTAVNADLAPTIVQAAGATPGRAFDGVSLFSLLSPELRERDIVTESRVEFTNEYFGLRTQRYAYTEYDTGEVELFDLSRDPNELRSMHAEPGYSEVGGWLHDRLSGLKDCSGAECSQPAGTPPEPVIPPDPAPPSGDPEGPRPIDEAIPDTEIVAGPADRETVHTRRPPFIFSSTVAGSSFECRVDDGAWQGCETPFASERLSDGTHVFKVRALSPSEIIDPSPAKRRFAVEIVRCGGVRATVVGTARDDLLSGTAGPDVIAGRGGKDRIIAVGGDDQICGGDGADRLKGGPGADMLVAGGGRDAIIAGGGRDRAKGGSGPDRIRGGDGRDRLKGGRGRDRLDGGEGRDRLQGGKGRDRCKRSPGRDRRESCR